MFVLGLNEGHGATAALLQDGRIIGIATEEKLNRIKAYSGYPKESVTYLMENAGIRTKNVDAVILSSLHPISFFTDDTRPAEKGSFYGKLMSFMLSDAIYWSTAKLGNAYPPFEKLVMAVRNIVNDQIVQKRMFNLRRQQLGESLGVDPGKIMAASHQFTHALAGYYSYPEIADREALILTGDGMGNHSCSAVYKANGQNIKTIAKTPNFHSVAFIYGMITKYLGMKFLEHEYKVMGLAPYADQEGVKRTYEILRPLITVGDDLQFHTPNSTRVVYFYLESHLKGQRFDWIAGAAQKLVEDVVTQWVVRVLKRIPMDNIVLGGGLFMNVKANMAIADMPEVKKVFTCPSSSDESCAIGACIYGYLYDRGKRIAGRKIEPLRNLYLGPEYSAAQIGETLAKHASQVKYERIPNIETQVALLLQNKKVVARFNGRMEFGARALGNRSILANPSFEDSVEIINRQIKNRDFWMPFAGTILKEREKDYIENEKDIPAPYMVMAFRTKPLGKSQLRASIHPYDKTIRPQVLEESANPSYHRILKEFDRLTGIGGVLNTSFNLHGEPIVCSPEDAMRTFLNSGLQYLAIGNYLVEKND